MDLPEKSNDRMTGVHDRMVVIVLALLLVVRLSMVAAYPWLTRMMPEWAWSNNDGYDAIAVNWVGTGTYALHSGVPTASRLPAYPLLIAAAYVAGGALYPLVVMIVQALLSTATGVLLFRMTNDLFGRVAAIATTLLFILHPQANIFVFRCATETLFSFLVMALLFSAVRYVQAPRLSSLAWASMWFGVSLLTRQTLAPWAAVCVPLLLLWPSAGRSGFRVRWRHTAVAVVVAVLILTPWTARNFVRSGYAPVLQTWVGQPLFQGMHVSFHLREFLRGDRTITELDMEALSLIRKNTARDLRGHGVPDRRPIAREVVADRHARRLAREEAQSDPLRFIGCSLRNVFLAPVLQMTWRSTIILMLWNWPLLILAGWGAIGCVCRSPGVFRQALPVVVLFVYTLGVHAMIWPQARYILPALLPFSAFAGLAVSQVVRRWRAHVPGAIANETPVHPSRPRNIH